MGKQTMVKHIDVTECSLVEIMAKTRNSIQHQREFGWHFSSQMFMDRSNATIDAGQYIVLTFCK